MNPVTGLSVARIVLGILTLVAPRTAARLLRLDGDGQPQLSYLSRMFGSREIALGAATLAAPAGVRRPVLLAGVAVDACDAAAGLLAGRSRAVSKPTAALLTVPAVAALATGIATVARERA